MIEPEVIEGINKELAIEIAASVTVEQLQQKIAVHIDHLINNDMNSMINILYRIDIDEANLKGLLKKNDGENAANLIAGMIIERQVQKFHLRKNAIRKEEDSPEEEGW